MQHRMWLLLFSAALGLAAKAPVQWTYTNSMLIVKIAPVEAPAKGPPLPPVPKFQWPPWPPEPPSWTEDYDGDSA